jgi:DNA replication and repair protein RecF
LCLFLFLKNLLSLKLNFSRINVIIKKIVCIIKTVIYPEARILKIAKTVNRVPAVYLKKLELRNYRNYIEVNLDFDKNTILILGNNGNGKTNLLESVYYLSTGKSHKTYIQDEIIKWDSDYSTIKALIGSDDGDREDHFIEIELRKGDSSNTKIRVDKTSQRKKSDFISLLPSVIFSPDDLKIIKSGPYERRDFLDNVLEKIDGSYYGQRLQYQKILSQRNSLIKSMGGQAGRGDNPTLGVWDDNIIKYGIGIIKKRSALLNELKAEFKRHMGNFFKGGIVDIFYIFSWEREEKQNNSLNVPGLSTGAEGDFKEEDLREIFYSKLKENIERDLQYKTTTIGPHRDDFVILLDGRNIRFYGSQGQQRAASISLKLCELRILRKKINRDPVLLLDDVFSEFDIERKKLLVKAIGERFQTFVTATNMSYLDKLDLEFGSKLLIKDNKVTVLDL